jgi:hypothetical protein
MADARNANTYTWNVENRLATTAASNALNVGLTNITVNGGDFIPTSGRNRGKRPLCSGGGAPVAPPVLGLFVIGDCYYPNGEGYNATYEVQVTYQLEQLVNGAWSPVSGQALNALAGGQISESVSVTSHHATSVWSWLLTSFNPTFGGVWCTSGNSACTPDSLNSSGQFTDWLSGYSGWVYTANQSFFAASNPVSALPIYGASIGASGTTVLNNVYAPNLVKLNGTLSPTKCN